MVVRRVEGQVYELSHITWEPGGPYEPDPDRPHFLLRTKKRRLSQGAYGPWCVVTTEPESIRVRMEDGFDSNVHVFTLDEAEQARLEGAAGMR